jgi:hypothetical protein
MASRRKSTGLTNRDLGIGGGSGKGSATRVKSSEKYAKNYASINWGRKPVAEFICGIDLANINSGVFPKNAGETVRYVTKHKDGSFSAKDARAYKGEQPLEYIPDNEAADAWNKVLSKNVFVSDAGKIERKG